MCIITVLSVNASAYAGVLDTISGTKISGYTMGAHRIAEGTFSWYGKGHDHLIMTTAVKASSGTKFSGFCLEAGKYWGDDGYALVSDSYLDVEDESNEQITKAMNYWVCELFQKNNTKGWTKSDIGHGQSLNYSIIQLYIWGLVDGGDFLQKSTETIVAEMVDALSGIRFKKPDNSYVAVKDSVIEQYATKTLNAIRNYNPDYYTQLLVTNNSYHQRAAFIITEAVMAKYGDIGVYKTDNAGNPLNNIVFGVYEDEQCTKHIASLTTGINTSGKVIFDGKKYGLKAGETFFVQERAVGPNKVVLSTETFEVEVVADKITWVNGGNGQTPVKNTGYKGAVTLYKEDDKGNRLLGAAFSVDQWNGAGYEKIGVLTDCGDGTYTYEDLEWNAKNQGKFRIRETKAPTGYIASWQKEFVLSTNNQTFTFTAINSNTGVEVFKYDANNPEKKLSGAEFKLAEWNGSEYDTDNWLATLVDNGDGTYSYYGLVKNSINEGKFMIVETGNPEGYSGAWSETFTITSANPVFKFEIYNKPTELSVAKYDITGSKELSGATLQIIDKNGNVVEEWVSTDEAHIIEGKLIAGETYILREISSPAGYIIANEIEFTVSTDGSIDSVEMVDDTTKVEVSKFAGVAGNLLPGAKLQILDSLGNVVEEWITDGKSHYIEAKLVAGETYVLHEVYAPDGYNVAADIFFTVSTDGSLDTIGMIDKPTVVKLMKYDENNQPLSGAKLQILDMDGSVVEEWTSDEKPHELTAVLNSGETYILHEVFAPAGYTVAPDVKFTVSKDGSVDEVVLKNLTTKVQISKKTVTGDDELPGATLRIIDKNGNVVEEWVSTDKPHFIEAKLNAGETYTLKEVIAPDGYVLAEEIQFSVSSDGSVDEVVMHNDTTKVEIHKVSSYNGTYVVGATLQISKTNGEVVGEWITTDAPRLLSGQLLAGQSYILSEIKAPAGYEIADDMVFKVSSTGETQKIVMKDDPVKPTASDKTPETGDEFWWQLFILPIVAALVYMIAKKKKGI